MEKRPNKSEELFLNLGYNHFYDLFNEIMDDSFWEKENWYRFYKISSAFSVYVELLTYEPFKHILEHTKKHRPPMESEIANSLFKFVRNVIIHFPIFETWNQVWVSKELINWQSEGRTIDKFLTKFSGNKKIEYRFWEDDKKEMTYISIQFPKKYDNNKIYLKDIISEKDGVKFSFILMRKILNTQIETKKE